ncbi:MAG TPA: hypothetical protein VE343_17170 [Streptosporangiaceae bacterium]|nr:hypothetical protein [Streptosporangiaceae bacterium]
MAVRAVIFDWGGTLTPWQIIDHEALWLEICSPHYAARAPVITRLSELPRHLDAWGAA